MNKNSMSKLISEEVARIPRGPSGSSQNELRSIYKMRRQHGLSHDPNQSPAEPFAKAIEDVRTHDPEFQPNVTDPTYFGWDC